MMRLAKREKYLIAIAGSVVALFFLFQLLILPVFEKKARLQRNIIKKEEELSEIALIGAEIEGLKGSTQKTKKIITRRKRGFTLFSFLEQKAGEAQIKDHIKYMKPSSSKGEGPYNESLVEIKLESITLKQLVGYLYRIEKPEDLIIVKRMSIKGNKNKQGYLDAVLQVLTFQ
jgi:general secretion pathway protein M